MTSFIPFSFLLNLLTPLGVQDSHITGQFRHTTVKCWLVTSHRHYSAWTQQVARVVEAGAKESVARGADEK